MRHWISFPRVEGKASRQAHADLPDGTYEREIGREGFFGPATHMYHAHPPTGWSSWDGPLRPRAFDFTKLNAVSASPWEAVDLLGNASFRLRLWRVTRSMQHLVRNGDGDEIIFVHEGHGDLYCDYGHLAFRDGDFIVLPRGVLRDGVLGGLEELIESIGKLLETRPDRGINESSNPVRCLHHVGIGIVGHISVGVRHPLAPLLRSVLRRNAWRGAWFRKISLHFPEKPGSDPRDRFSPDSPHRH